MIVIVVWTNSLLPMMEDTILQWLVNHIKNSDDVLFHRYIPVDVFVVDENVAKSVLVLQALGLEGFVFERPNSCSGSFIRKEAMKSTLVWGIRCYT